MNPVSSVSAADGAPRLLDALRQALHADPPSAGGAGGVASGLRDASMPHAAPAPSAAPSEIPANPMTAAAAAAQPSDTLRALARQPSVIGGAPASSETAQRAAANTAVADPAAATAGAPSAPAQLHAEQNPAPATRMADATVTPALVTPLFTVPTDLPRPRPLPRDEAEPARGRRIASADEQDRAEAEPDDNDSDNDSDPGEDDAALLAPARPLDAPAPLPAPALATWQARLREAGQDEALRELSLRRRVLVVMPTPSATGPAAATAVMLGAPPAALVQRFAARWWPGPSTAATSPGGAWRLHRVDGTAQTLRTRPAAEGSSLAAPCALRLAPPSASIADPASAQLDIAQAQRFSRALGRQWSLLLVVLPADTRDAETSSADRSPAAEARA